MNNTRLIVLNALLRIYNDKAYSNIVLNNIIKSEKLNVLDSKFVSNLFYGVLETQIYLDYIISKYSNTPIKKMNIITITILRIGLYQIIYMDKVPNSAAVNEAVKLSKLKKQFGASGFINAILRSIIRDDKKAFNINKNEDSIEYLSIKYSMPVWLVNHFVASYGHKITKNLLPCFLGKPLLTVRVNTLKIAKKDLIIKLEKENVQAVECESPYEALILNLNGKNITGLKSFKDGYFHIQDLASQMLCYLIPKKPNQIIVDICSAPGGKAFTLAEMLENKGTIHSFDLYEEKIKLINENAKRLSISIIKSKVKDAAKNVDDNIFNADIVLCDVPCSGLGVIKRKPEIKYKPKNELDSFSNMQYRILCNAQKYTKVNGVLVYSTCTLNPEENNKIANKFLNEHKEYEPLKLLLPANIKISLDEPDNQLTFMPYANNTDGFFVAMFKKVR